MNPPLERRRLLLVSYQSRPNGAARMLFNVVKHLDRERFDPLVVFNDWGLIVPEFEALCPVRVLGADYAWLPDRLRPAVRRVIRRRKLRQISESFAPDLIYLNTMTWSEAAEWTLSQSTPLVVHFHEIGATIAGSGMEWAQKLTRKSSVTIGCAEAVSSFVISCLDADPARVRTVATSVDFKELVARPRASRAQARSSIGIGEDVLLVGAVGEPSFRKGVDLFIEAAAEIRLMLAPREVHFAWVGGVQSIHETPFVRAAHRRVERLNLQDCFHWVQERADPSSLQAAMDVYVVSSREDPMPLGMLESLALGTPVVAFAVSGIPEALGNGVGELVDRVSADHLARAVANLLRDEERRTEYGRLGPVRVAESYDIVKNVVGIETALDSAADAGSRQSLSSYPAAWKLVG